MPGVLKEIFTDIILEKFYPNNAWLSEFTNLDALVDNNTINVAEAGADPDVVENNSVWPLVPKQRTDRGIAFPLSTFDTEPTHLTKVEELETSYDKAASILRGHINQLYKKACLSAAYNVTPDAHTSSTPVIKTSGKAKKDSTKALTYQDITDLSLAFDEGDLPQDGRILLLSPVHKWDLKNEDMKLYKQMMTDGQIENFKVYTFTGNPRFDVTTGKKMPYGSATGNIGSTCFINTEVLRAMGDISGEPEERWADYRGWLLGMQMRFLAMPFRKLGYGAIYSDKA